LALLKLRQRSVVERKMAAGEIKHKSGVGFVYTDNEELEFLGDKDQDDSDEGSDEDDENDEADVVKNKKSK